MIRSLDETQIKDVLRRICDIGCLQLYYVWLVPGEVPFCGAASSAIPSTIMLRQ
jgi:hypothetical protein